MLPSAPPSEMFVVVYVNVGLLAARTPIVPLALLEMISGNCSMPIEKSVEFLRSGELSFVSTALRPHGANCCEACESYAKRAPGSLLTSFVASYENVALRPKPEILRSTDGVSV